ncbi:MAG: LCP family protein [Geodermatophilaceae bacterium]|nr:LCP family protein [Geodermatophilaceae bacterium]
MSRPRAEERTGHDDPANAAPTGLPPAPSTGAVPDDLSDSPPDDPSDGPPGDAGPRRPRRHRVLLTIGVVLLVMVLLAVGFAWYVTDRYAGNITRIPGVFSGLDESTRPAPATPAPGTTDVPLTFLLVGVDSEAEDPVPGATAGAGDDATHSEVLMLVQLAADRQSAVAVSIPEDSVVPVPGYDRTNISAAFATGGPTLLVQTVELLTDIRIDHYLSVDFAGFAEVTDALGGVDVRVAEATQARNVSFTAGVNHLDGEEALAYVRQRAGLPEGQLDSVRRHQNYLRAVMTQVARDNLLTDPARLDDFLLAVTNSLSVDDEMSNLDVVSLVLSLRNLDPSDVGFLTVPVATSETGATVGVVDLDLERAARMWIYIQDGSLQEHINEFDELPAAPR